MMTTKELKEFKYQPPIVYVAMYSDGFNIIIGYLGLGFKLVLLVLLWWRWYFVGRYPLAKCWWKIKVVEKNEDFVRF